MTDNIYIEKINKIAKEIGHVKIMEVCGGHTNTIMRYGMREILPQNIELISGPGCPVCVTSQKDIDSMIELAKNNIPITTYGDMLRVPGSLGDSLEGIRAKEKNAKIVTVYSAADALKYPDHVFFGIGFETTSAMTAFLLSKEICVYSAHKIMPPPMKIILDGKLEINGFLDPGHVSTITGSKIWDELKIPQVISGFKPEQIIRAIYKLLLLIKDKKNTVINDYTETVTLNGNEKAKKTYRKASKNYRRGMERIWKNTGIWS